MFKNRQSRLIIHLGPSCPGGMKSAIDILCKSFQSQFIPTYSHYRTNYFRNFLTYSLAIMKVFAQSSKSGCIYQLHTSKNGSFLRKLLLSLLMRAQNKDYIIHIHGSSFEQFANPHSKIRKRIAHSFFFHASAIVVLSDSWKMYFSTAFPDLQNIKVIPNPCSDIAKLPPSRKDRSVVKLLFAGMYSPKKGIYDLIVALSAIKLDDSIELHCFGSGDLEGVKNMAADFQVSASVHVHPWLDHDTYLQKLADYDVFILPSYAEGLPMTILEAMGQGLPIISTTVGGIPSAVISNHNGYLINPGDIASLSSCIETLSTNPDMRYEMGVNSWNIAKERFSLGAIRGLWKNLYGNTHIINRRLSGKYYSNNQLPNSNY